MTDITAKIVHPRDLPDLVRGLRESGNVIVFTNGCFDLLHVGHVRYLACAKTFGDVLVVGLNADTSVAAIKEKGRPVIQEAQRAEVLAGLACVDFVTVFREADPLNLIHTVQPDVLVKGADWAEADIVGGDWVKSRGGSVQRVQLVPEISTSRIIERIVRRFGLGKAP